MWITIIRPHFKTFAVEKKNLIAMKLKATHLTRRINTIIKTMTGVARSKRVHYNFSQTAVTSLHET